MSGALRHLTVLDSMMKFLKRRMLLRALLNFRRCLASAKRLARRFWVQSWSLLYSIFQIFDLEWCPFGQIVGCRFVYGW